MARKPASRKIRTPSRARSPKAPTRAASARLGGVSRILRRGLRSGGKAAGGRKAARGGMRGGRSGGGRGTGRGASVSSITPFLWFDNNFEEAARFYVSLFPGSRIDGLNPMGGSFTLAGQRFMGLNGGPQFRFTPAVSFFVVCRDQAEVDRLWAALEKGGKPTRCGWIDDRFGLTWQIIPEAFLRLTSGPDPAKTQAVFAAMMGMVKMDVAGLQAAYDAA